MNTGPNRIDQAFAELLALPGGLPVEAEEHCSRFCHYIGDREAQSVASERLQELRA